MKPPEQHSRFVTGLLRERWRLDFTGQPIDGLSLVHEDRLYIIGDINVNKNHDKNHRATTGDSWERIHDYGGGRAALTRTLSNGRSECTSRCTSTGLAASGGRGQRIILSRKPPSERHESLGQIEPFWFRCRGRCRQTCPWRDCLAGEKVK